MTREVDLIEEVARHCGFDRIPVTFPALTAPPPPVDPRIARARQLRALAIGQGFSEAVTFGFTSQDAADAFAGGETVVPIKNPLSEAFAVLRPSLLPGLVESAGRNVRRGQRTCSCSKSAIASHNNAERPRRSGSSGPAPAAPGIGASASVRSTSSTRPASFRPLPMRSTRHWSSGRRRLSRRFCRRSGRPDRRQRQGFAGVAGRRGGSGRKTDARCG